MRAVSPPSPLPVLLLGALCLLGGAGAGITSTPSLVLLCASPGGPRAKAQRPTEDAAALASRLRVLFKSWKAIPDSQVAAKSPPIKDKMDATLVAYVTAMLDRRPRPTVESIQRDVSQAQKMAMWVAIYGVSPAAARSALKSNPQHLGRIVRGVGSASGLYAAAFDIGYGNVFSTRIHGFAPLGGKYRAVGETSTLGGAISGVIRLKPFTAHELRFIVWCLHIGSPEGLTSVAVYKLDRKRLEPLWVILNFPAVSITLRRGLVVLESRSHTSTKSATIFHYERDFYQQVPAGLKRVRVERWTEH